MRSQGQDMTAYPVDQIYVAAILDLTMNSSQQPQTLLNLQLQPIEFGVEDTKQEGISYLNQS